MLQKKRQCKGSGDLTTIKDGYNEVWGVGELYDDEKSLIYSYILKFLYIQNFIIYIL
jgi:hypothetical protein